MTLADQVPIQPARPGAGWLMRLVASRRFQSFVSAVPGLRRIARADGEALFDLVAGFVQSQVLAAVVELRLLHRLMEDGPLDAGALALGTGISAVRISNLCDAACALGLMVRRGDRYRIARRGAALIGVPGLEGMISHHSVLYRDMADPLAVLRGEETKLAQFWPYVFGARAATDPSTAQRYSDLMADSQVLVAEETLRLIDLSKARHVLDVGGGTGAFLTALGQRHAGPRLHLFDLPAVVPAAESRFAGAGLSERSQITPGSFRDQALPEGADTVTLIRVLYDHSDETVMALLRAVREVLPPGGRVVVSEPMTGGRRPNRSGDVYFRFYCMAMATGKARPSWEITDLLRKAGFDDVRRPRSSRPFVTSVVTAVRP